MRTHRHRRTKLDEGLDLLRDRLGLARHQRLSNTVTSSYRPDRCMVYASQSCARTLVYGPDMDGEADPGEVVWFWAPCGPEPKSHLERAMIVVGHQHQHILGLLVSPNTENAKDPHWIDIGSGPWDEAGRPCWVRLDKVIAVPATSIRRQGTIVPHSRFERIANRLRTDYGWS
ncbi:MAG: type II toxin-antitoxin system PemK/MazF family toxin [Corynebacterium sp.]|nr:type II toxin-antitoxin system PemK/MazF family toxin [Corynebacterium sp.]